ncbi:MAG: NAD(P)H-binding protein [Candidatus Cloacimonetes bacterium]|jgi:uncharacterized protein YbjT (DUF2867 family)|nr:NAD(P)H-binding protein [Candidatus Cloacimonadota bacterium]
MKIVIVGGTGRIGSRIVARLRVQGHDALAAAPDTGVNTVTGEGLDDVLRGADVVIDVSNSPSLEGAAAFAFFSASTGNLLAAGKAAGIRHHVALSIVGTDRLIESGYFQAKLTQERAIEHSTIPFTIVRATQFFEFIAPIADAGTDGDVVRVPPVMIQPMAADDVAEAVTQVALEAPQNGIVEVGGPERFDLDDLIRRMLAAAGDTRSVVTDPHARYYGAAIEALTLVPAEGARLGQVRFDDWLSGSARASASRSSSPTEGRAGDHVR